MLLAGDIGGTKTKLAIYSPSDHPNNPLYHKTYKSNSFEKVEYLIQNFLDKYNTKVTSACFGVAGPVKNGVAKFTNLAWTIEANELAKRLNIPSVTVLNDLCTIAYGVSSLADSEKITINAGKPQVNDTIAVIAPGTGLGEAYLTHNGNNYVAHACEGGHVDFGPRNEIEIELLQYLLTKFEHVSYENICSGIGAPNIFAFLHEVKKMSIEPWLAIELENVNDITPVIMSHASNTNSVSPICDQTLGIFINILAAAAGNLALKFLPTGGLYIAGGVAIALQKAMQSPEFWQNFIAKGRISHILYDIPVYLALPRNIALRGAACFSSINA